MDITYKDCTEQGWMETLTRRGEMLTVYRPGRERQVRFINDYGQAEEWVYGTHIHQMKLEATMGDMVADAVPRFDTEAGKLIQNETEKIQ